MSQILSYLRSGLRVIAIAMIVAMVGLLSLSPPINHAEPAHSQVLAYRLNGGPFSRETWLNFSGPRASFYYDRAQLAIASWNLAQTSGGQYVASFTQVFSNYTSEIDWYSPNAGMNGYVAWTDLYQFGGTLVSSPAGGPTANWDYALIRINDYSGYQPYADATTNTLATQRRNQSTMGHEMGHAMALAHNATVARLMYATINRYDSASVYTPQAADITALDGAY